MIRKSTILICLVPLTLITASSLRVASRQPLGVLLRCVETGDYETTVGGMIEIPFEGDSLKGPVNLNLEIDQKDIFEKNPRIMLSIPQPKEPGAADCPHNKAEIRAYLFPARPGQAIVTVTPIYAQDAEIDEAKKRPRKFHFKVDGS